MKAPGKIGRRERPLGRVNPDRGVYGDVVGVLGVQIVSGRWKPGDGLPTEAEFVREFDVSRTVVREALRVLRAKGLVESRQMAGSRVLPRSHWRLLDPDVLQWRINSEDRVTLLRDLLEVRLIFEPAVARAATQRADERSRRAVREAWQAMLASHGSRDDFIDADIGFHAALLAAAGNELLEQLFSVIEAAQRLLLEIQMTAAEVPMRKDEWRRAVDLHRRVVEAFTARDAEAAEAAMREVINRAIRDANKGMRYIERLKEKRAV